MIRALSILAALVALTVSTQPASAGQNGTQVDQPHAITLNVAVALRQVQPSSAGTSKKPKAAKLWSSGPDIAPWSVTHT